ncbi:hypothetical protein HK097_000791 [Rhizophlyctis rosea]|uniref:Uncharacterized protein n=1 Tax=Rhizophlyctis rosea TaxID=64517 RepID=A0AAD5SDA7_9FUNG|nr:hypothetical protein HK097_000791 [Rhizophlyctis rosea]
MDEGQSSFTKFTTAKLSKSHQIKTSAESTKDRFRKVLLDAIISLDDIFTGARNGQRVVLAALAKFNASTLSEIELKDKLRRLIGTVFKTVTIKDFSFFEAVSNEYAILAIGVEGEYEAVGAWMRKGKWGKGVESWCQDIVILDFDAGTSTFKDLADNWHRIDRRNDQDNGGSDLIAPARSCDPGFAEPQVDLIATAAESAQVLGERPAAAPAPAPPSPAAPVARAPTPVAHQSASYSKGQLAGKKWGGKEWKDLKTRWLEYPGSLKDFAVKESPTMGRTPAAIQSKVSTTLARPVKKRLLQLKLMGGQQPHINLLVLAGRHAGWEIWGAIEVKTA